MAIQVNGTTVIDNSRNLTNIASVDAATKNALAAAGIGGVEDGSATQIGSTLNFGTPSNSFPSDQTITLPSSFGQGLRNIALKLTFNYSVSYGGFYGGAQVRWRTSGMGAGQYVIFGRDQWSDSVPSSFSGFYSYPMVLQAVYYGDSTTAKYAYDTVNNFKIVNGTSGWTGSHQNQNELKEVQAGQTFSVSVRNNNDDTRGVGVTSNAQIQLWVWDRN